MDETALRSAVLGAVAREYGLDPRDPRVFKGEFDRNVRIADPERGTWLIKISDERTPTVALDWQETVLDAAVHWQESGRPGLDVATPRLLANRHGDRRISLDHGGETFRIRVVEWIDGDLLSACPAVPQGIYEEIGRVSAALTGAFAGLTPPAELPEHTWLAQRSTHEIRAALDRLPHDDRTRTVAEVVARFESDHADRLARVPWGVVHQDLHDDNTIVAGGRGDSRKLRLIGVIDFNDAHRAPLVADPAVAAAYATLRADDPRDRIAAVVAGYEEIRELSDDERALMEPLALLRLCTNWSVWSVRAAEAVDPEYAMRRSRHTWAAVEALVDQQ